MFVVSKKYALVMGLGLVLSTSSWAALNTAPEIPAVLTESPLDEQIENQKILLAQMDDLLNTNKASLKKKTEAFHLIQQKPHQGPTHVWQNTDPAGKHKKDFGLKILGLSLREGVKELEILENRRLEAQAELEWLQIQKDEIQPNASVQDPASQQRAKSFQCRLLPLKSNQQFELTQGFGPQKDAETGIEWNSMGWWLAAIQTEVSACESGRVVFVGDISGRGRVVMLDHGAGHLTVYANLNPDSVRLIRKGQRVEAGATLGLSLDRVYFEYRTQGVASDPKAILRADLLSRLSL